MLSSKCVDASLITQQLLLKYCLYIAPKRRLLRRFWVKACGQIEHGAAYLNALAACVCHRHSHTLRHSSPSIFANSSLYGW